MNLLKSLPGTFGWCVVAVFIAANLTTLPASAASIPVQSFHKDADGVTLTMSPGKMKLTVCSEGIVRVMYSPTATLPAGQDFVVTNHSWPATSFKIGTTSRTRLEFRRVLFRSMKLTVCSEGIVRVMYSPTATLPAGQDFVVTNHSWPATSFKVADSGGKLTITTRKLKITVNKATGAVQFFDSSNKLLLAELADGGKTMTPVTVNGEESYQPQQIFNSPTDNIKTRK